MKTSDQTKEIFAAIVATQAEMPAVPKTAENLHFRSRYAPLDAVAASAGPVLARHGLAIVQGGEPTENGTVRIATRLVHVSGQWIESSLDMIPAKFDPQAIGACVTYASRYGYRMAGVVTDDDDDGNSVSVPHGRGPVAAPNPAPRRVAPAQRAPDAPAAAKRTARPATITEEEGGRIERTAEGNGLNLADIKAAIGAVVPGASAWTQCPAAAHDVIVEELLAMADIKRKEQYADDAETEVEQ